MDTLIKALLACVIGLAVGLWATVLTLRDARGFDAATIGPWTVSEKAGAVNADPYTRAALERSGEIPLAVGEGLQFIARVDDSGATLNSRCVYLVGRSTPPTRYWTLVSSTGRAFRSRTRRSAMGFGRAKFYAAPTAVS